MRPNNIYIAELYLYKCKIALNIPDKIFLTFRIGKNMVQNTINSILLNNGEIDLCCTLQLNTDKLALDTQRSSLTISSVAANNQVTVIGIAIISIAQNSLELPKRCKLSQCSDKNAEVQLSLKIRPLDSPFSSQSKPLPNSILSSGNSSSSNMDIQQLDKKVNNSPRLSTPVTNNKVLPPKPKSLKELPNTSESLRESVSKLQCQCDCLKELLKVQLQKSQESNKLIDELVSVLEEVNQIPLSCIQNQLDQTLLLEGIDKQNSIDHIRTKNQELQKQIANLNLIIQQLRIQNSRLNQSLQKTNESTRKNSRDTIQSLKEVGKVNSQKYLGDSNKKVDKFIHELILIQTELFEKVEQIERFKKKMKIASKFSMLQCIAFERSTIPAQNIRAIIERFANENKQMMKIILKYAKHESDIQSEGLVKLKQKIDKTFTNLLAKKMNRDILTFQKGQLLKSIQDLWAKQKFI